MPTDPGTCTDGTVIDDDTLLSAMALPYSPQYLSDMSVDMCRRVSRPHPKIPEDVLKNAKISDGISFARNPRTLLRNQELYSIKPEGDKVVDEEPKYKSQQNQRSSSRNSNGSEDSYASSGDLLRGDSPQGKNFSFPRCYRKVEIKYSKFGVEVSRFYLNVQIGFRFWIL
jgi:hypothetical protein